MNRVPRTAASLMVKVYRNIFPGVHSELSDWEDRAKGIPNKELRRQAVASIASKRFHCQGGAVYALLAGEKRQDAIRFIVAYQTISDYLDNLCDRSTSMDPDDFRLLHQALNDALSPGNPIKNYYALREDQNDGAYLVDLVQTCQEIIGKLSGLKRIQKHLLRLAGLYGDLQVHKHVAVEERIPRLTTWYDKEKGKWSSLGWHEFSAAAGSTLGIFCIVSYALGEKMNEKLAEDIIEGYFPFMQGLHILLDYYIDQEEDTEEADLNFCSFYQDLAVMKNRFVYFIEKANKHVQILPDTTFHKMIHHGLVGLYLGDPKVGELASGSDMRRHLLKASGPRARFFYWNTRIYYKLKNNP